MPEAGQLPGRQTREAVKERQTERKAAATPGWQFTGMSHPSHTVKTNATPAFSMNTLNVVDYDEKG